MKKILILGGSGFIGNSLYRELYPYFDTYGTYFNEKKFSKNQNFFYYNLQDDNVLSIVKKVKPQLIISCLRGPFAEQLKCHEHLVNYIQNFDCRLMFLSSSNVFDAFEHYPSYEFDKTLSESPYGRFKIRIENSLLKLPPSKYVIARLPMVFGNNAPRTKEIENLVASKQPLEVFPNTIVNVTSDRKLSQQIHYIINQKLTGIFHLGSIDLITHFDFIKRIISRRKLEGPIFKQIFTSNQMRYLAVLPKENKLPSHLNVSYESILEDLFLL